MNAKDFCLQDKNGKEHKLSDIPSRYKVLYFYPKDNTPGCIIESKEFSSNIKEFEKEGTTIIGISGGDNKSKQKFCELFDLKITLLSDPDFKVSKLYGVYGEKSFMGKKYLGISRTTFVIDNKGNILKKFENVKPLGHAKEVLNFIKNIK